MNDDSLMPWRMGRLLQACGYTEVVTTPRQMGKTAALEAMLVKLEPTPGQEPPRTSIEDVLVVGVGETIAKMQAALESMKRLRRRPGDTMFNTEQLDAFAAAGCSIDELTDGGITINLPGGGCVPGIAIHQALTQPLLAEEFDPHIYGADIYADLMMEPRKDRRLKREPDYLKHDPTKRHSRRERR